MRGHRLHRRLTAGQSFRRACAVVSIVLLSAMGAKADQAFDDDIALTKATISLLAAKDNAAFRDRLDPASGQLSDDNLRKMSDIVAGEPTSIETISLRGGHNIKTGDGNSGIILEYLFAGKKWVVVSAIVRTKDGSKKFTRFFITPNGLPLREINAFHFFGKGRVQYLFLVAWIAVIALTAFAMFVAFKRHTGWRRWAVPLLMPLGLTPTLAVNWNTAQMWVVEAVSNPAGYVVPVLAFRYPMAAIGDTEVLVPFLYISAPLFAIGYLIWYWTRPRQQLAAPADQPS